MFLQITLCAALTSCFDKGEFAQKKHDLKPDRKNTNKAQLYAPGVVSTGLHEHSFPSFSPDQHQVLWTSLFIANYGIKYPVKVLNALLDNNSWSEPVFFKAISTINSYEAFFSLNGKRIYFTSNDSLCRGQKSFGKQDIWFIENRENKWSDPINLGETVNSCHDEFMATVSENQSIYYVGYFTGGQNKYGIYFSVFEKGEYQTPELLPNNINSQYLDWCPFIARDESYLLFSSNRPGGFGGLDIYISYKDENGLWQEPLNLGEDVNTKWNEKYPYISPDRKLFFFTSDRVNGETNDKEIEFSILKSKYGQPGNGWGDIYFLDTKIFTDNKYH